MSQKALSENALKIYVYMITRGKKRVGPREVQRAMNFASPSSAIFHLKKLVENGLIEENRGEYYLSRIKRIGVLSNFYVIRRYLVPKDLVYLLLIGVFAFIDVALFLQPITLVNALMLIPIFIAIVIFFLNTLNEISLLSKYTSFENK